MYQQGIENYKHSQVFRTSQFFYEKRSSDSSPSKYFSENSKILDEGISIKTNDLSLIAMSRFERLDQFFHKNPKIYGKVAHLVSHYDWLATIYRTLRAVYPVLRDEEGNIENKLEIGRMLPPISQLNLQISKNELVTLAKVTKCHSVITYDKIPSWNGQEKDELIHYLDLLEILKRYLENIEMGEDLNISQLGGNQPEIDQIYSASEEFLSNKNGSFELSIDFCVNCKRHQTSTRHNEREIANWYNEVLGNILEEFPACEIIGNKYGPASIGTFGVYIEGIGNDLYKDNFGRLKIYKRKNEKPNSRQILDAIYLVSFIYENPQNLANLQAEYKRTHSENPKHQDMIVGQARVSEETALDKSHVDNLIELQSETIMYCKNWGCVVKIYQNGKNHKKACRYHPGK